MAEKQHVAYVLPEEHASSMSLKVFPDFPGRFMPGEPLGVAYMGISEEDADALIAEHELPLEKVEVSTRMLKKGFYPDEMHAASAFEEAEVGPAEEALAEAAEEHDAAVEAEAGAATEAEV